MTQKTKCFQNHLLMLRGKYRKDVTDCQGQFCVCKNSLCQKCPPNISARMEFLTFTCPSAFRHDGSPIYGPPLNPSIPQCHDVQEGFQGVFHCSPIRPSGVSLSVVEITARHCRLNNTFKQVIAILAMRYILTGLF